MDQLDIDSSKFDCQKYVSEFLKNHSVQDLIQRHNQLQSEIKEYDQDIQSLVFENYSKFISSIDTVKKMKTDITQIDQKVETLAQSMTKIAQLSRRIDSQLSIKREEIIKLDTVNKDLSRLNSVCNFPHIIQKELDQYKSSKGKNYDEYFNETAQYYKQCYSTLDQYKNEPLIQPIYKETNQKLDNARQILWSSLIEFKQQNPLLQLYSESKVSISTQEARSAVKKLIQIMDDEEAVLRHYQKIIKERYLTVAKELIDKAAITKSSEVVNLMDYLEEKRYDYTVEELEEYKQMKEKEIVNSDSAIQGSILWLINQLCQIIFKELKVEVSFLLIEIRGTLRDKSLEQLSTQCIKEIIHGVFQGVTDKMSQKKINNVQVNEVFVKLQTELQSLFENNSIRQQLRTEIIDKFTENVENICRGQVFTSFSHLRVQFLELLVFAKNDLQRLQPTDEIKREIMTLITVIKQKLIAFTTIRLLDLKAFVFSQQQSYLREQETYLNLIQASLIEFVKFVGKIFAFRSISISQEQLNQLFNDNYIIQQVLPLLNTNDSTYYYLFSNQFLQLYSKTLSNKLFELVSQVFQGYKIRQPTDQELNKLKTYINGSTQKNLMLFAQAQSEHWINIIFQYLNQENVVYQQQITQKILFNEVKNFIEALGLLFPDTKRGLVKKVSIIQQSTFNIQMEIVMVRKCKILETNINDRNSLLITVVKYVLKVLLQKVRGTYFSDDLFKQFQVDLYFVMQLFYDMVSVDEEGLIAGFYMEILDCAGKNCKNDVKIDPKILESLSLQARM
ncbi:unnamed protein product [Paramecium octaurelia]|uniref:Vacuolar protein sorting-associated protein 51 homolog n=1 Tax=Paramecium octaurelia TaxID=43137 RepID=A0A8S1SWN3_PAROT|nr:unnamed protein product [Paramecium octaurelia]